MIDLLFARSETGIAMIKEEYEKLCKSLIGNILNSEQDVEECLNDVYLGIWNTIPPNRPDSLKAYICGVSRNVALKKLAYNLAEKRNGAGNLAFEELEDVIADPCEEDVSELTELINLFLKGINKKSRKIFVKRYYFAMPVKEIADQLKIPPKTVAVNLFRTRNKLKRFLEKEGYDL